MSDVLASSWFLLRHGIQAAFAQAFPIIPPSCFPRPLLNLELCAPKN